MITGTSPQGLRYAVRRSGRAVAFCALTIGCGTRDEEGYPAGIAHFVEHTLFRGTRRKSAAVINGYLDKLGGELNAYTTKEEIVLHATVLKEDWKKAAGLLFELATEASFPEAEIETERGVILDEIISYKDNPAEDVYDRFETLLFEGTPLETPILGTTSSVKRIKADMLRRFVAENFIPSKMVFSVVADIDEAVLEKDVLKMVSGMQAFSLAKKKADARENASPAPLVNVDRETALKYLHGDAVVLPEGAPIGPVTIAYEGHALGPAKNLGKRCNNLYPKNKRIRMDIR